jgi:hypothetical protein
MKHRNIREVILRAAEGYEGTADRIQLGFLSKSS